MIDDPQILEFYRSLFRYAFGGREQKLLAAVLEFAVDLGCWPLLTRAQLCRAAGIDGKDVHVVLAALECKQALHVEQSVEGERYIVRLAFARTPRLLTAGDEERLWAAVRAANAQAAAQAPLNLVSEQPSLIALLADIPLSASDPPPNDPIAVLRAAVDREGEAPAEPQSVTREVASRLRAAGVESGRPKIGPLDPDPQASPPDPPENRGPPENRAPGPPKIGLRDSTYPENRAVGNANILAQKCANPKIGDSPHEHAHAHDPDHEHDHVIHAHAHGLEELKESRPAGQLREQVSVRESGLPACRPAGLPSARRAELHELVERYLVGMPDKFQRKWDERGFEDVELAIWCIEEARVRAQVKPEHRARYANSLYLQKIRASPRPRP